MTDDALSTYPGFSNPIRADHTAWLDAYRSEGTTIVLKSGARVPIPLLFWQTRALCVDGLIDADAADVVLAPFGRRAAHVNPANIKETQPGSGLAHAQIWAPQYGGTGVGPVEAVYGVIYVQPLRTCKVSDDRDLQHLWWWWYYGIAPLNHEFKGHVWGVPSQLAALETSYGETTKEVRLLENGRTALRLRFDTAAVAPLRDVPAQVQFMTVARRATDDGENLVVLRDYGPVLWAAAGPRLEVHRAPHTAVSRDLAAVDFKEVGALFFDGYDGVVKIYNAAGSAIDPGATAVPRFVDSRDD